MKSYINSSWLNIDSLNITSLNSPVDFRTTFFKLIKEAKERIYITALYWENDETGRELLDALIEKSSINKDIKINIFIDYHRSRRGRYGETSSTTDFNWYKDIISQYSNINIFSIPVNTREIFGVLHIKGIVIDNNLLYSGASINNIYFQKFENYRLDRYFLIKDLPLVEIFVNFIDKFFINYSNSSYQINKSFAEATKSQMRKYRYSLKNASYIEENKNNSFEDVSSVRIKPLFGIGRKNNFSHCIHELLFKAKEKVIISTPYFNFPNILKKDLESLLIKGVKVEIIVGDKKANDFFILDENHFSTSGIIPYVYEMNLKKFAKKFEKYLKNNSLVLNIWEDSRNSFHAKGLWVDDQYMILSGNNLNPRSYRLDAENGLLFNFSDLEFKKKVEDELLGIKVNTRRVSSYKEIDSFGSYPKAVKKVIKKFTRLQLIKLAKYVL
ncbi:MAG: CDP-diacylglycerol--serine O-phosphatidyltransferase [Psittacicella sp.]